ncbi:MAG: iron-sulfur cluster assembly accessory protein [Gammaproteobacteria bacterium]|nr:iron-sulfur cluster assembly accessory protein [Gammaproteobacteria bacterium]
MNPVTITDAALKYIRSQMIKEHNAKAFRLSIKKTGCSGFAYQPKFVETGMENDIHYLAQDGLPVYIDPLAEPLLNGLMIDLHVDKIEKKLIYLNPNEKDRCGCGESFTI